MHRGSFEVLLVGFAWLLASPSHAQQNNAREADASYLILAQESNQLQQAESSMRMAEMLSSNQVESLTESEALVEAARPVDRLVLQSEEQRVFTRASGGRYIEIASGLNYQDDSGVFQPSRVIPKTLSDGSVTFDELPVKHTFAPWSGQRVVVESSRRGGPVARSALGGLSYYDLSSGKSALIAWVTNSPVQAYDGGVFYERAFLGVDADILYKVHPWGLEQDVVIFGGLPDPKAFGMDPAQTKLCALTELVDFDLSQAGIDRAGDVEPAEPAVASLEVSAKQGSDWKRLYNWQPGYAYPEEGTLMVGAGDAGDQAHPVAMRLFSAMGRVFLSEEVPIPHVTKSMPGLLDAKVQDGVVRVESIQEQQPLALPPVRSDEKLVADQSSAVGPQAYIRRTPRYVLDYVNYYGTNTAGVTFASGQTYYISAPLIVSGGKLIIQPNAIVKLATGAYVKVQGSASVDCRSHAISPAYFTSAYDTNVGEVVLSGASPISNRYAKGLSLTTESNQLSGLMFRYADTAIEIAAAGNHKLRDLQTHGSLHAGIISGAATAELQNVLVYDGADGLHLSCQKAILENCTFQKLTNWAVYGITSLTNLTVRNSLFYEVLQSYSSNNAMSASFFGNAAYNVTTGWMGASVVSLASNTFAVGTYGSNYLISGSAAINAGTTNADLLGLYHYTTATNGMKETNSLVDIGFHYGTVSDQDGDGMPDYLEDRSGDGLYASNSVDSSNWSTNHTDDDTLPDAVEYFTYGTNPKSTDTDNDGFSDALEVQNGSDPLNASSTLWSLSGTVSYSGIQTGALQVLVTSYEPLTNRPAMDYSFDEDRGGYTPDINGSGLEAIVYGATWNTNGAKGGCYTFDGNDRISLGRLDAANGQYNLTWTAWMRYTGGGVLGGLLGNTAAGNEGIMLMKGGENLRADITPQSRTQTIIAETGGLVTQGIWQMVSGTYDGTQVRLYLNGDLVATSAVYSLEPIRTSTVSATVGDVTDGRGWYFYGDVDEVRIYKSTFTANQMKSLYFEIGGSVIRRDWTTNILAASTDFAVPNLPSGSNYWVTAWRDANGNGRMDHWEAQGRYSGFVGNLSGHSNNLAITLADPDLDGDEVADHVEIAAMTDPRSSNSVPVTAAGQVIYGGGQTGPIYITARPYETIADTPLLRYSFNTSNSTIVLDESGNGITGLISNAKWTSRGIRNGAYRFDGNANINLGDLSAVEGRTGLTWGAWVNQSYSSSLRGIMGKMVSYGESFLLVSTPSSGSLNSQVVPQSRAQARDAAVNGVATGMVWQYVAGTYDGQQTRLYLDGQLIATSPVYAVEGIFSNNTVAAVGDVAVGRGWYMNGRLDDVHIYGRCFNTNEMYNLAASIRPENIIRVTTNAQPGAFAFTNLPNARKYWFEAYRDSNGNGQRDSAEVWVVWSNNPAFLQSSTTNINLTLTDPDSDQDGMPDWWEIVYAFDPYSTNDMRLDRDGDGLENYKEYIFGANPDNSDSDGDVMSDGWEFVNALNPANAADATGDPDSDGLANVEEYRRGTDPANPDSDGDSISDGPLDSDGAGPVMAGADPNPLTQAPGAIPSHLMRETTRMVKVVEDKSGRPIVAWRGQDSLQKDQVYVLKWFGSGPQTAGQWADLSGLWEAFGSSANERGLTQATNGVNGFDLAINTNGDPAIVWNETRGTEARIYFTEWAGSNWTGRSGSDATGFASVPQISRSYSKSVSSPPNFNSYEVTLDINDLSLAVDRLNRPWVSYLRSNGFITASVQVKYHNGTNWSGVGNSDTASGITGSENTVAPRIVVDSNNTPYVGYWRTNWNVYVRYLSGTSWNVLGGAPVYDGNFSTDRFDLTIDGSNWVQACIQFMTSTNYALYLLRYKTFWAGYGGGAAIGNGLLRVPPSPIIMTAACPRIWFQTNGNAGLFFNQDYSVLLARYWATTNWLGLGTSLTGDGINDSGQKIGGISGSGCNGSPVIGYAERIGSGANDPYRLKLQQFIADSDGDGLSDVFENANGLNPNLTDSDGDGLSDGLERNFYGSNPAVSDTDGDGISDGDEVRGKRWGVSTDPLLADSDEDGIPDKLDVLGNSPNSVVLDTNTNGIPDAVESNNIPNVIITILDPRNGASL